MKLLRHLIATPFDLKEMIGHEGMTDALVRRVALYLQAALAVGFLLGVLVGKLLGSL